MALGSVSDKQTPHLSMEEQEHVLGHITGETTWFVWMRMLFNSVPVNVFKYV